VEDYRVHDEFCSGVRIGHAGCVPGGHPGRETKERERVEGAGYNANDCGDCSVFCYVDCGMYCVLSKKDVVLTDSSHISTITTSNSPSLDGDSTGATHGARSVGALLYY
jgi:hypothetical protein